MNEYKSEVLRIKLFVDQIFFDYSIKYILEHYETLFRLYYYSDMDIYRLIDERNDYIEEMAFCNVFSKENLDQPLDDDEFRLAYYLGVPDRILMKTNFQHER